MEKSSRFTDCAIDPGAWLRLYDDCASSANIAATRSVSARHLSAGRSHSGTDERVRNTGAIPRPFGNDAGKAPLGGIRRYVAGKALSGECDLYSHRCWERKAASLAVTVGGHDRTTSGGVRMAETTQRVLERLRGLWRWLRVHVRALQALAAIFVILGVAFSIYKHFFPNRVEEVKSSRVCASFDTYPDNSEFGSNVSIEGIIFQSLHRSGRLFVNQSSDDVKALQFMNEGLTIDFPGSAELVEVELAEFASPIVLEVLGKDGKVLDTRSIDRDNTTELLRVREEQFAIYQIRLSGGHNEGGVVSVCAQVRGIS